MMDIVIDPSLYDEDDMRLMAQMFLDFANEMEFEFSCSIEMVLAAMAIALKTAAVEGSDLQMVN